MITIIFINIITNIIATKIDFVMLLLLIVLLLFSIAGQFRTCGIRKYRGAPSKHILWLLAWRRSGGLYKMDHHFSFPVQQRRYLKSRRRDLQMANLLLLTLLLLSLLLVVADEYPKTKKFSSLETKAKTKKERSFFRFSWKKKKPVPESNNPVPESNNPVDRKIEEVFGTDFCPKNVAIIVKIPATREETRPDQEVQLSVGTTTLQRNKYLTLHCQPKGSTEDSPSALTKACFMMLTHAWRSRKVRVETTIFNVYDEIALSRLQENLVLPTASYKFYVRCMKKTDLDRKDAECRGGPARELNLDRLEGGFYNLDRLEGGFYKSTTNSRVIFGGWGRDKTLYYFGTFEIRFEKKDIGKIKCDKGVEITLEAENGYIRQEPENSEGLFVVDGKDLRALCKMLIITAQETTILKMLGSHEAFPFESKRTFKGKSLKLIKTSDVYYVPFEYKELPHGKNINVFHLFPHSSRSNYLHRSYVREKDGATGGGTRIINEVHEFHCHSGNRSASLDNCIQLFRKLPGKNVKYDNYVVSPKLSYMGSFTRQLFKGVDQASEIDELLPMFFLKKRKGPSLLASINNAASKILRHTEISEPPEGPKNLGDFSLSTLMSATAFRGGIVLTHNHNAVVKEGESTPTRICSNLVIGFSTRNWKIYVDETLLVPETRNLEWNSYIMLTFGAYKIKHGKEDFKNIKLRQLPNGSKLIFRHREDRDLDYKDNLVVETCDGERNEIDKTSGIIEWDLLMRWIGTSRDITEWGDWDEPPISRPWHYEGKEVEGEDRIEHLGPAKTSSLSCWLGRRTKRNCRVG